MVSRLPTLVVLLNLEVEITDGAIKARISRQILEPKCLHVYS
jgi:hypothetical protein